MFQKGYVIFNSNERFNKVVQFSLCKRLYLTVINMNCLIKVHSLASDMELGEQVWVNSHQLIATVLPEGTSS